MKEKDLFDLTGRTALITGGAGLLGTAHAKALLSQGAKVILSDINSNELVKAKSYLFKDGQAENIELLEMRIYISGCSIRSINEFK